MSGVAHDDPGRRHSQGRLVATERFEVLLDEDSFRSLEGDGVPPGVAGKARINGRPLWLLHVDADMDPALPAHVMWRALRARMPLLTVYDDCGGEAAAAPTLEQLRLEASLRGRMPRLSLVLGQCTGVAAVAAFQADWVFMVVHGAVALSPPSQVGVVRHQCVSMSALGGAETLAQHGRAHARFGDEVAALRAMRYFFDFLPRCRGAVSPAWPAVDPGTRIEPGLNTLLPEVSDRGYDMREVLEKLVDDFRYFELQSDYAGNVITAMARVAGRPVGVLATQPCVLAGCFDLSAVAKASRLLRFCDDFALPVVLLCDVPAMLPGLEQERGGLAEKIAELRALWGQGGSPRLTLLLRMCAPTAGVLPGDMTLAWRSDDSPGIAQIMVDQWIAPEQTRPAVHAALQRLCEPEQ